MRIPPLDVRALAREEIEFHRAPALCVVGPELWRSDPQELGRVRKALAGSIVVPYIENERPTVELVERLALYGADDVLGDWMSAEEFVERLLLLKGRLPSVRRGRLVVCDSAKGGVGVTSIAGALADCAAASSRVVMVDLDGEGQALSRYFVSPRRDDSLFVEILSGRRAVNRETVSGLLTQPRSADSRLQLLAPPGESAVWPPHDESAAIFMSLIAVLLSDADLVVIDSARVQGELLARLYHTADTVLLLFNDDPATLYPTLGKVGRQRPLLGAAQRLLLVQNGELVCGVGRRQIREAFRSLPGDGAIALHAGSIPFCARGSAWAGSGRSFYTASSRSCSSAINRLALSIDVVPPPASIETPSGLTDRVRQLLTSLFRSRASSNRPSKDDRPDDETRRALPHPVGLEQAV